MKRLIQWSIDHHWIVIALSIAAARGRHLDGAADAVDVFPDLTAPTVTILAEGHGMAPEEMESLVTFPIESAINGASGVRRVRSATAVGIGVVWVEFDWGTDIYIARQLVAEKLALVAGTLPPQVERPVLAPISSIMGEILFFALSSETAGSADDADGRGHGRAPAAARRAGRVAGDARSAGPSGSSRSSRIRRRLRANDVSLTELLEAVRGASENASAGIFTEGPQEYVLQAVGRVRNADEIGDSVVAMRGTRSGPGPRRRRRPRGRGAEARRGIAQRQAGGHRRRPEAAGRQHDRGHGAARSRARRAPAASCRAGITIDRRIFRQADFIQVAVNNVIDALRDGGILVIAVVFVFLANMRAAAITLTAMPLSLAAAILVLRGFGATINTMTLGGLAIAIGALVDDAIIDVENVVRRLRENAARLPAGAPRPPPWSCAMRRSRSARRSSSRRSIIVLVFLPIFGLSGVEGRLLTPLAFAYIVALLASLAVAIVVTPALCYRISAAGRLDHARPRRVAGADAESAVRPRAAVRARPSGAGGGPCRLLLLVAAALATTPPRHSRSCRSSTRAA